MKLVLKILGGIGIAIIIGFMTLMIGLRSIFGKHYDTQDLIENYEKRSSQIIEVKEYIKKITPENFDIYVEFDSNREIDMEVWEKSDTAKNGRIFWFQEWNINPYNYKQKERSEYDIEYGGKTNSLKEVIKKLNWQDKEFRKLKSKLDKANCISIDKSGDIYTIGFQRSGMGKYHYKIFDNWSIDEIKQKFNGGCLYKYYKENVVLEYGGGAIGMQCFEDFYTDKEK
ncbi:MAG: hypothetical protein R2795_01375 [Saprospiraceae bacterium]